MMHIGLFAAVTLVTLFEMRLLGLNISLGGK